MKPLVFFDGTCGLCNGFVDFLIRHGSDGKMQFAALQGETAKTRLPPEFRGAGSSEAPIFTQLSTIVFMDEKGKLHQKSDAALLAISNLGGLWKAAVFLRGVPKKLRDVVYDWVARNRYRWFGRRESCRIPTPEERGRILP